MRYHFVVNGYADNVRRQMEEQKGFAEKYLSGMEQKEAVIYCRETGNVQKLRARHAKDAVFILSPKYVPEIVLDALCSHADSEEVYIFGSDDTSIELAVRMAARLSGSSVTEAEKLFLRGSVSQPRGRTQNQVEVRKYRPALKAGVGEECSGENDGADIYVHKMVYANHMEAVFAMNQGPYCLSLARGGERRELEPFGFQVKEEIVCEKEAEYIVSQEFYPEDTENSLEHAKVILAAGRGVKNKENMAVVDEAAECLGAEVAVSRPAAMNAWKPMNRLIGVSGAMAGPEVCITAGVSGAAAFYAGIEKSRFIAAINTDEKAPIMKMADVAIVDDFLPVMEELKNICK